MLRSVLLSAKGGVALDKLETDYVDLVGFPIPVRELGFRDLPSLLRSIPDICTLQWSRGRMTVSGVADNTTNHIKDMVAKQTSIPSMLTSL